MEWIMGRIFESPPLDYHHDHVLKFLLVGDSDVGKDEILACLKPFYVDSEDTLIEEDDTRETDPLHDFRYMGVCFKSTNLMAFGKRIKLDIWSASGQQFSTVFRSYSRGTQGVILVFDITNKWSFNGLDRWLKEIDLQAPGVPKILVGNRRELEFRRTVCEKNAKAYAAKHNMIYAEMSPLCNFNIQETFSELARMVIERNGLKSFGGDISNVTLQDLCYQVVVKHVNPSEIDGLVIPSSLKSCMKSYWSNLKSNDSLQKQIEKLKKQKASNVVGRLDLLKKVSRCSWFGKNPKYPPIAIYSPSVKYKKKRCIIS